LNCREYVNPLKTNVHDIHHPEIIQNLNDTALHATWMLELFISIFILKINLYTNYFI
jgi:hypothetical protein